MALTPAERQKRYRERHPDRYAKQVEAARERARQKPLEERVAYNRKWRSENPERMRELRRQQYRRKHERDPEYFTVRTQNRRTKTKGVTQQEWKDLVDRIGGCLECGSTGPVHMHHVIWLQNDGEHKISNVIPLCQPCHVMCHKGELGL